MILVDTSVLIDYFKGNNSQPVQLFDQILEQGIRYGINDFIYQELLQGARTTEEFTQLNEYLENLPFYNLRNGKESHKNAALLYFQCRKQGYTIRSTIDLLIAESAIEHQLYLLHNDADYDKISRVYPELRIYQGL
ncbi:type II toxin-antitoxin system VapC family toxin [Spirochaeta dissipatitropha]